MNNTTPIYFADGFATPAKSTFMGGVSLRILSNRFIQPLYLCLSGIVAALFVSCSRPATQPEEQPTAVDTTSLVYICTGIASECYHTHPDCDGLSLCGGEVQAIPLDDAIRRGRRPCNYCNE